jgi:DNA-3-methyladenine glycosylase
LALMQQPGRRLERQFFAREPDVVARELLGCVLRTGSGDGRVSVRLTETEAYHGATDPASHAFRGRTARNDVMFGRAGHLYLYFVYGMHWCANIVTGHEGAASAVLLRAGEVVEGIDVARARRPACRRDGELASGPARLATVAGWGGRPAAMLAHGGDLCGPRGPGSVYAGGPHGSVGIAVGPRVGVAAAKDEPLRFWLTGDPTVTTYRRQPLRRQAGSRGVLGDIERRDG